MGARLSPLFSLSPGVSGFVTFIGATTAMFAATVGLLQNDIKCIVAYSTYSQLGYMFVAMGVGANSVGMYHLFTHAFFKALLFLGSSFFFQAEDGIRDGRVTGVQTCALPISPLTAEVKDRILSTNAAEPYGIDLDQARQAIQQDSRAWINLARTEALSRLS